MKNYRPSTTFQEKLNYVYGHFARFWMVFVMLVACGMTVDQVAAQGLVAFSPASASFGNVDEGSSKALSMTIWNDDSKLDTSLVSGLKYTDATVTAGTTYKFVVTAVDSLGLESAYSAAISATEP
jgi:hypothetical protein